MRASVAISLRSIASVSPPTSLDFYDAELRAHHEHVEDRLVDLLEADVVNAGALEDARGHFGIPKREWVRAPVALAAPRRRARRRSPAPIRGGHDLDAALAVVTGFQSTSATLASLPPP